jgi:hypothetical protein
MTDTAGKPKRKKSQKRQRTEQIKTPLTKDEFNRVAARANTMGLSRAAFSRLKMLDETGERSLHIPPVNAELVGKLVALHAKYGSNLNQIAYQLNAYGLKVMEWEFRTALKEWGILRDLNLEALNKLPPGGSLLAWNELVTEARDILTAHPGAQTIQIPAGFLRRIAGDDNAPSDAPSAPIRSTFLPPDLPPAGH